jgi:hypothetical protein
VPSAPFALSAVDLAAVIGGVAALIAVGVSIEVARRNSRQVVDIQGTALCISYREHVIELHDRGMTVEQIRALLALEGNALDPATGLLRIEGANGCVPIEEIVNRVPRRDRNTTTNGQADH